ncbi:MAG: RnfABCDGE type electron transport complex subunit G [Gammaproteobacteria bacterium]|nr:RnfABCDGE type electron transport complex subunit G [Gammaproteobacteria bacterium]NND53686.1 RnfABCDGE type electron transport complex subunit G [Gammaproteobacteria bacterium]
MNDSPADKSPGLIAGIVILVVLAAVVTAVLALTSDATAVRREQNQAVYAARLLRDVIPDADYAPQPGAIVLPITGAETLGTTEALPAYPLYRDGNAVGVVLTVIAPDGYVAPLTLLVGIDREGKLTGVRVTEHRETPGLGDQVERNKSDWITTFDGRSLAETPRTAWALRLDGGEFDHISGATITSRAVVNAVGNALKHYDSSRDQLLTPPATTDD